MWRTLAQSQVDSQLTPRGVFFVLDCPPCRAFTRLSEHARPMGRRAPYQAGWQHSKTQSWGCGLACCGQGGVCWRSEPTQYVSGPPLTIRSQLRLTTLLVMLMCRCVCTSRYPARNLADLQSGAQVEPSEGVGPSAGVLLSVFMAGLNAAQLSHLCVWLAGMAGVSKPD